MSLSKKDYVAIAKVLNEAAVDAQFRVNGLDAGTVAHITADLAQVFEADNPRFDTARFIAAALSGEGI